MRYLHTMVRVTNLEQSLDFYCNKLGLKEVRRIDHEAGRFTLVFVAAPGQEDCAIELTHNWDTKSYDLGNGFGHLAIAVGDAYKACEDVKAKGGKVTRPAGPMKHGGSVIAFVEDPDGYKIEFIERR